MEIAIKKVGQSDGNERFILVDDKTRQVITIRDVSEDSLRRFFKQRNIPVEAVEQSLARARKRYEESHRRSAVDENADTMEGDDLLFQLGLEEDSNAPK